jgi:glycosyltransferase involved in cell wall biosynthesis
MKTASASQPHAGVKPGAATSTAPISVCIHTLLQAQDDHRLMRGAAALAGAGYSVVIVDVEHDPDRPPTEREGTIEIQHIRMPRWLARFYSPHAIPLWMVFKVARMVAGVAKVLRTPADIYHASEITALPACYVASRLRRKPLIFETHEYPLVQPHITSKRLLHALSVRLLCTMMPACAGVIVVSPPIATEMQREFGGPLGITVRNVPPYSPPVTSNRLRQRLGLGNETRIALYQGGIQENRTLDVLIRAARYLDPGIVIVMMGDGPLSGTLQRMIAAEGVGDRVKMIPAVPYQELLSWTASADLGLLVVQPDYSTSVKLSLPNKLFEYLMAGLPVLTSEMDAIVATLREYGAGDVIQSLQPEDVGRKMSMMLADREAWQRMHENAFEAARKDLHWEVEQERIVALYERMLGSVRTSTHPMRVQPSGEALEQTRSRT